MKIIAFYLPQFHTFPENDKWWGKGFTEWTNTKKGTPNFKGHYQPQVPQNHYYYDLQKDKAVIPKQIALAKRYGIDGFCFYHYWFANGKKLMEKPIERFLDDKTLDIPFCLCWANENWSRRWDGSEQSILIAQDYGDKEDRTKHIEYLIDFFKDERYMRDENGRPILLIYKPQLIDNLFELLSEWRDKVCAAGFPGICFVCQYPQNDKKIRSEFDNWIDFEPAATTAIPGDDFGRAFKISPKYAIEVGFTKLLQLLKIRTYKKYSYEDAVNASENRKIEDYKEWLGAFPGWDNTARRGKSSIIYDKSTPQKFEEYVCTQLIKSIQAGQEGVLFINAWNEWAEGAHLEPDERNGFRYLEAVKSAREKANAYITKEKRL